MKKIDDIRATMRDIVRQIKLLPEKRQDEVADILLLYLKTLEDEVTEGYRATARAIKRALSK